MSLIDICCPTAVTSLVTVLPIFDAALSASVVPSSAEADSHGLTSKLLPTQRAVAPAPPSLSPSPAGFSSGPTVSSPSSSSFEPADTPSSLPSIISTSSNVPSLSPSISGSPSQTPTVEPSFSPSTKVSISLQKTGRQTLQVDPLEVLDSFQVEVYQRLMQNYTASFGHMVGRPYIFTTCKVSEQSIATNGTISRLLVTFSLRYESRYGYDLTGYANLFQTYVNSELEKMTASMQKLFFDNVIKAERVQLYRTNTPTYSPPVREGGPELDTTIFITDENPTNDTESSVNATSPSTSFKPSRSPSSTLHPSLSRSPSDIPSISQYPSVSPTYIPSFSPSTSTSLSMQKRGTQFLLVDPLVVFDPFQLHVYQRIMQNYTASFGHRVGKPFITSLCNVTEQKFVTNGTTEKLMLSFSMRYESRYGYELDEYIRLFQDYINNNLDEVTFAMQKVFLGNVVQAQRLQMFQTRQPTNSPTMQLAIISSSPTYGATEALYRPTNPPTTSLAPTVSGKPSLEPTSKPSTSPSISKFPSLHPSSSKAPSATPSSRPSFSPSTELASAVQNMGRQMLEVEPVEVFGSFEVQIYQRIMNNYTASFGHMVTEPFIVTTCLVTEQQIAEKKLIIQFSLRYESKYGYNIDDYPRLFQEYVNGNLDAVTATMNLLFLDSVIQAEEVQMYYTNRPTYPPSGLPRDPTSSPTYYFEPAPSEAPTSMETILSSTTTSESLTYLPTISPSLMRDEGLLLWEKLVTGFVVGLAGGAALSWAFIMFQKRQKRQDDIELVPPPVPQIEAPKLKADVEDPKLLGDDAITADTSVFVGSNGADLSVSAVESSDIGDSSRLFRPMPNVDEEDASSDSQESIQAIQSTVRDAFEKMESLHGNINIHAEELESMRETLVRSVQGSENMMSVAMMRALMDDDDSYSGTSWNGSLGVENIEADVFYETHDWLRRQDRVHPDAKAQFFQEILDKMVVIVRRGYIRPDDATRAIHGCATMLGLPLEQELPENVVLITSLIKSNTLAEGKFHLEETFEAYGAIETAAIAPKNHGFGFVRFYSPKSVQRAMQTFRVTYIEVQDSSVMLKTLRDYR